MIARFLLVGFTLFFSLPALLAEESADEKAHKNTDDTVGVTAECFQTKRVHTISRLDESHVVAELLGGKKYVLGVEARCRGLENAVSFAVTSRGTRVCPSSFAELVFTEKSQRSMDCRIETVELLTNGAGNGDDSADVKPQAAIAN